MYVNIFNTILKRPRNIRLKTFRKPTFAKNLEEEKKQKKCFYFVSKDWTVWKYEECNGYNGSMCRYDEKH